MIGRPLAKARVVLKRHGAVADAADEPGLIGIVRSLLPTRERAPCALLGLAAVPAPRALSGGWKG
jgi:hypothetical protein